MAVTEHVRDAGRRLASDLRALREERGIDTDSILEATRLSADILEAFEESGLVDHPTFNRVYLRSIVGSYARLLEIDDKDVFSALDATLEGRYHGALRQKYLLPADHSDGPSFSLIEAESDRPEPPSHLIEPVRAASEAPGDEVESDQQDPVTTNRSDSRGWILGLVSVFIIAVLAVIWFYPKSATDAGAAGGPESEPADSTEAIERPDPEPEWIMLGDSIRFDVIATTEPLDPIRVKVDNDMRRPYWIEHLDTLTFYAVNSIAFERELDVADILMDGYLLPDSMTDESGQLFITRPRAQAWLDTLAVQAAKRR